jgi:type IV pilus assembly protein PilW
MNRSAASNSALYQIKAIRVALVMRTALPEQQTSATSPAVQTTTVTLFNDLLPAGGSATPITRIFNGPNEQNYRYRTIEVTIPIRNNLF